MNSEARSRTGLVDPLAGLIEPLLGEDGRLDPLVGCRIAVEIVGGLAAVRLSRRFRNEEKVPIEAVLTFPVPTGAVLHRVEATVDGRRLRARVHLLKEGREIYEKALEDGKTTSTWEELMPGIHVLQVGNLVPGAEVEVSGEWAMALESNGDTGQRLGRLRIPTTIGDVYGRSGLEDAVEPAPGGRVLRAALSVKVDSGTASVVGRPDVESRDGSLETEVPTDAPVDLRIRDWRAAPLWSTAADGRRVEVRIAPNDGSADVDAAILVDRSGSMDAYHANVPESALLHTKHAAACAGLRALARRIRPGDRLDLWEFNHRPAEPVSYDPIRDRHGLEAAVAGLAPPDGGTEIGRALARVFDESERQDVLLITDGMSHALPIERLLGRRRRVFVVLVGEDALDSKVGKLAIQTGGGVSIASGGDIGAAIGSAWTDLRSVGPRSDIETKRSMDGVRRPIQVNVVRGGTRIEARWSEYDEEPPPTVAQPVVGRFAAGLALFGLPPKSQRKLALDEGLLTEWTGFVLVDEDGERTGGIAEQRKARLATPRTAPDSFLKFCAADAAPSPELIKAAFAPDLEAREPVSTRIPQDETETTRKPSHLNRAQEPEPLYQERAATPPVSAEQDPSVRERRDAPLPGAKEPDPSDVNRRAELHLTMAARLHAAGRADRATNKERIRIPREAEEALRSALGPLFEEWVEADARAEEADADFDDFREEHGLSKSPMPRYPKSRAAHFSWLAVIALGEALLNTGLLRSSIAASLLGGLLVALPIPLVNIGSALGAGVLFRYANHRSAVMKAFGLASSAAIAVGLIFFNLLAAHFHQAVEAMPGETILAGQVAWQAFSANYFGIDDLQSWAFAFVGMLAAAFAAWTGYRADDRYPGHGRRHRKILDAQNARQIALSVAQKALARQDRQDRKPQEETS